MLKQKIVTLVPHVHVVSKINENYGFKSPNALNGIQRHVTQIGHINISNNHEIVIIQTATRQDKIYKIIFTKIDPLQNGVIDNYGRICMLRQGIFLAGTPEQHAIFMNYINSENTRNERDIGETFCENEKISKLTNENITLSLNYTKHQRFVETVDAEITETTAKEGLIRNIENKLFNRPVNPQTRILVETTLQKRIEVQEVEHKNSVYMQYTEIEKSLVKDLAQHNLIMSSFQQKVQAELISDLRGFFKAMNKSKI